MSARMIYALVIGAFMFCQGNVQGQREPLFGIQGAPYELGYRGDEDRWNNIWPNCLFGPSDVANLRFAHDHDTTDIVIIIDSGTGKIRWYRINLREGRRRLDRIGWYGRVRRALREPCALAVASAGPIFDPANDLIYVADKIGGQIIIFSFAFDADHPSADSLILQGRIRIDDSFDPLDLDYINFNTSSRYDNRLLALDQGANRLFVFSDRGDLLSHFDLSTYDDSIPSGYAALAHRVIDDSTAVLYMADDGNAGVRMFILTGDSHLEDAAYLNLGDRLQMLVTDVAYREDFGLFALESLGPRLFRIAEDLSHVIDDFDSSGVFAISHLDFPHKMIFLPERVVFLANVHEETGIISFSLGQPQAKPAARGNDGPLPIEYALYDNYPNPFNSATTIHFSVAEAGNVKLTIYNILGQQVRLLTNETRPAGRYSIRWDGRNAQGGPIASGVYFYRLEANDYIEVKKMLLLR